MVRDDEAGNAEKDDDDWNNNENLMSEKPVRGR